MASLFKSKTSKPQSISAPKPPEMPKPTRMPTLMSGSVQEQKRRAMQMAQRRKGRMSTILTDQDTTTSSLGV